LSKVTVPATTTSPGSIGNIAYDAQFVYICVDTNYWLKLYASTF
jgi:hypothetical protein